MANDIYRNNYDYLFADMDYGCNEYVFNGECYCHNIIDRINRNVIRTFYELNKTLNHSLCLNSERDKEYIKNVVILGVERELIKEPRQLSDVLRHERCDNCRLAVLDELERIGGYNNIIGNLRSAGFVVTSNAEFTPVIRKR